MEYYEEKQTYDNINELCNIYNYDIDVRYDRICFHLKQSFHEKDNVEKDNVEKDNEKIAILMDGMPRFYEHSIRSIKKFASNYNNVDYFFSFWDVDGKINNLVKYKKSDYFEKDIISMNIVEQIFKEFKPVMLQFIKYSEYECKINELCNLIKVPHETYGNNSYKSMIVSISLINNIGIESFKQLQHIKKYKYFFKIRPDSIIDDYVDLKILNNNIVTPLSNSHDVNINKIKISINEQMVFTGNFQHLCSYCNVYNQLLELYEIIHNIDASVPVKYFREVIMGYYIKIICNIDVKEVNIQTGIVRNDKILYYDKNKINVNKYITYDEYESLIKH